MFTVEHTLKCKGKLSHPQALLSLSNILTREETPTRHGKAPCTGSHKNRHKGASLYIRYIWGGTSQGH